MEKIILLFGFDDLQGAGQAFALQTLTKAMDVTVRCVDRSSLHRTMLSLVQEAAGEKDAAGPGTARQTASGGGQASHEALPARMLLFAAFSDQELYRVLDLCPACGITRDDLKASLTPANSRWDAYRLCANIQEEHRRLSQN